MVKKKKKKIKRRKKGTHLKPFRQGNAWVLALPSQLTRALEINKGDKIAVGLDDQDNLIIEEYNSAKLTDKYPVAVRVIGGAKLGDGFFPQLGFTIPSAILEKVKEMKFKFPIIEEKRKDRYFRIVYRAIKEEEKMITEGR